MALARFLVDKSALARAHERSVLDALGPLITAGLVGLCGIVEAEMLVSARNVVEHDDTRRRLRSLEWLPMPDEVWSWVADAQRLLTERGQHRSVPIPDLLIAATAHRHQLTVLHYDTDFDLIADATGVTTRWVVPRGSL
ncbi:MAG: PIN domain nuclease [Pseudonocardia sp.]|nr:PIN domain nuclease [Pseudonocardia sp.]